MASDIITKEDLTAAESLIKFIDSCPSMFHTAMTLSERLEQAGYVYLPEGSAWTIERGGSYYTRRNNSSVIAWHVGRTGNCREALRCRPLSFSTHCVPWRFPYVQG